MVEGDGVEVFSRQEKPTLLGISVSMLVEPVRFSFNRNLAATLEKWNLPLPQTLHVLHLPRSVILPSYFFSVCGRKDRLHCYSIRGGGVDAGSLFDSAIQTSIQRSPQGRHTEL